MADFVEVLRKTIDAQANKSLEIRQSVYAKARTTIEQKLITSNASQAVAVSQRNILEKAITEVEVFYELQTATTVPPPAPEISGGPVFSLVHGKLTWQSIAPENEATSPQLSILSHLQVAVDDLIHQVRKEANSYPSLLRALTSYADLISKPYPEIDAMGLWILGGVIISYERAYREQNLQRTISNPLEPAAAATLDHVCSLHSALAMGIQQSRELILQSDQNRLETDDLNIIAESGNALLSAVIERKDLIDPRSLHFTSQLQEQMHAIGWRSTKQAYSTYITLRNIFYSLIRYSVGSEPNLAAVLGLATASMAIYGDNNAEFSRNVLTLIYSHSRHILAFFNHSPELRAYIKWAMTIAETVIEKPLDD